ncbi:glycosyl hydrolase family 61-domain-containing protein [Lasiosphaeris hirsuta]|uniref:lytic cellulose monooxygenase (C4-dehydrogenating) n=1 Tax=Lasiosphaeris hirsuta TaxID=260670 RepID=A0AA40AGY0_9PEZI|nr:glycosyl hydrolase family 61-domain-containing protein [Lasiosphaeris hirsuta]
MRSALSLLGLATTFATLSSAHTVFTNLFINDENQGDGTCIRMPKDGSTCTAPILGRSNPDLACGRDGASAVAFTCGAPAGAKLTFEFRMYADLSQRGAIDPSHKGPMAVYLKPVSDMASTPAAGDGWFKIWDEGYDSGSGKFATEKLIANNGLLSVNLPPGLPTGYYLVRHEIITLQNVTAGPTVDAQFYAGCAQLYVQGSSSGSLNIPAESKVSIPGHVSPGDAGLHFNIYDQPLKLPYAIPGPKVFFPGGGSSGGNVKAAASAPTGGIPPSCLIKNANWCGLEVADYNSETGCWAAVEACYQQGDVCYKSAPPTGSKGCDKWDRQKCDGLRDSCSAGNFNGPPNKGVKLGDIILNDIPSGSLPAAVNQGATPSVVDSGTTTSGSGGNEVKEAQPEPAKQEPAAPAPSPESAPAPAPVPEYSAPAPESAPPTAPVPVVVAAPAAPAAPCGGTTIVKRSGTQTVVRTIVVRHRRRRATRQAA